MKPRAGINVFQRVSSMNRRNEKRVLAPPIDYVFRPANLEAWVEFAKSKGSDPSVVDTNRFWYLIGVAEALRSMLRFEEAAKTLQACRELVEVSETTEFEEVVKYETVSLQFTSGSVADCERTLDSCLAAVVNPYVKCYIGSRAVFALSQLGKLHKSIHLGLEMVQLATHEAFSDLASIANQNLSVALYQAGLYEDAIEFARRAIHLLDSLGRAGGGARSNLAIALSALGRAEEALETLMEALQQARDQRHKEHECRILVNLGETAREARRYEESIQWLQKARASAIEYQYKRLEVLAEAHIGLTLVKLNLPGRAIQHLERAADDIEILEDGHLTWLLNNMIDAYELAGDLQKLASTRLRLKHYESQQTIERQLAAKALATGLQLEDRMQLQTRIKDLNGLLQARTNELLSLARERREFKATLRRLLRGEQSAESIIHALKEQLRAIPDRDQLLCLVSEFETLHPEFRSHLVGRYAGLNETQIRICVIARLGYSSLETSKLLSLSERTIENHRYRLRKLFGLKTEEKLSDFLQKL